MKKGLIIFVLFLFLGCEEVIDLKLDSQEKRLVIDAALDWEKGKESKVQKVYLSYTNDFYAITSAEKASGAIVKVTTYDNETYLFTEQNKGEYVCTDFSPKLNKDYLLLVEYEGKRYTSKARMREVPEITTKNITQREDGGIFKDKKEIRFTIDTDKNQENSFIVKLNVPGKEKRKDYIYAIDNKFFTDGKLSIVFTGMNYEKEFEAGDTLEFTLYRVSSQYKQIMDLLLNISLENNNGGGPPGFTTPTRIYGNITNEADSKENPLGAFRVAQYTKLTYVVK